MKNPSQPELRIIRYWHPRLGGWHHAYFVRTEDAGRKGQFAVIRDLRTQHSQRVAISDVKELAA
jgi:hypothetical protein